MQSFPLAIFKKIQEIKKIFNKILSLILDAMLFTFQTVRKIVLPNRKRKGNILSSLFIFFTGITERLNHFEYGLFKVAGIFKLKYLKQAVSVIATFLFFHPRLNGTLTEKI